MKAFENIEIVTVGQPSDEEVLERIRRDEPCHADPMSEYCRAEGKDKFLIDDIAGRQICKECHVLLKKQQQILAAWEEWCLAMQDVYA